MNIVIRADASASIGAGHVMRCLALADALRCSDVLIQFICRSLDGDLIEHIRSSGYSVSVLPDATDKSTGKKKSAKSEVSDTSWRIDADLTRDAILNLENKPDWLIVDHYGLDIRWERELSDLVGQVLVIDDLADRDHQCDLILDQNFYIDADSRYDNRVPDHCVRLLGPRYALLRDDFSMARERVGVRQSPVRRVLVMFGGSDSANLTSVVLAALKKLYLPDILVDVVVGQQNTHRAEIQATCQASDFTCYVQPENLAELMTAADLAVGAGGSTSWERCCVGLPCLTFVVADNQEKLVADAGEAGFLYAPDIDPTDHDALARHILICIENPILLRGMSTRGMKLVDANGCQRIIRAMGISPVSIRVATNADCRDVFEWRNDSGVRQASMDSGRLNWSLHQEWYAQVLIDVNRLLLIGESGSKPVGVVRFDITNGVADISIFTVPGVGQKGLGSNLLLAAERFIQNERPDVTAVRAEVLGSNVKSQRLFRNNGYSVASNTFSKGLH